MQKPKMMLPLKNKDLSMTSTKKFELEIIGKYKKQNNNSYLISGYIQKKKKEKTVLVRLLMGPWFTIGQI
jgi:uncharacterized beta-barrel protein YwiB (DUF1934 family)